MSYSGRLPGQSVAGISYFVSSSEGDDAADGMTPQTAWRSFRHVNDMILKPGDSVLLKRGDVWHERLCIRGGGTVDCWVFISAYGQGAKPMIRLNNQEDDICMVISELSMRAPHVFPNSYILVEGLDLRCAEIGVLVRSTVSVDKRGLVIRDCEFSDIYCHELLNNIGRDLESLQKYGAKARGKLINYDPTTGAFTAETGGAGEYCLSTAVRFTGRSSYIFDDILLESLVFDNCIVGVEGIRMSNLTMKDCICSGSYAGIFRFSCGCSNMLIERCRLLGGSEKYTFFGGTCGAFLGNVKNVEVKNCEFSYEYNLGENDGCGFDFEYQVENVTVSGSALHHNDSGGFLHMQLLEQQHKHLTLENNLFYSNLVNPKDEGYNYEILLYNHGEDNISITGNSIYMRDMSKAGPPTFIGNLGENNFYGRPVIKDNVMDSLDNYRYRFENFSIGLYGLRAEKGSAYLKNKNLDLLFENGSAELGFPQVINGFYANILELTSVGGEGIKAGAEFTAPEGRKVKTELFDFNAGKCRIKLSDEAVNGLVSDLKLIAEGEGHLEIKKMELVPEITACGRIENGKLSVTFSGQSAPMLRSDLDSSMIEIEQCTVKSLERVNYNTVRLEAENLWDKSGGIYTIKVKPELFIQYMGDYIRGLDMERKKETVSEENSCLSLELKISRH